MIFRRCGGHLDLCSLNKRPCIQTVSNAFSKSMRQAATFSLLKREAWMSDESFCSAWVVLRLWRNPNWVSGIRLFESKNLSSAFFNMTSKTLEILGSRLIGL